MSVQTAPLAIDPLRPCPRGVYEDDYVVVQRGLRPGIHVRELPDGRVGVRHRLGARELDDDLADRLALALAPMTGEHEVFARSFTGIVLSSDTDPIGAWDRFYRASLTRGAGYGDIYRHAVDLLPTTSVLDLGCSFGFLALDLAARGTHVTACDIDAGTVRLVRTMAGRLGRRLGVLNCDAASVPLPAHCVDAVAVLHLLEHLDCGTAIAVLGEALRLARDRVVVAVPYETVPNSLFGHLRTMTAGDLTALGIASGWDFTVYDHHGGWLVLDRTSAP